MPSGILATTSGVRRNWQHQLRLSGINTEVYRIAPTSPYTLTLVNTLMNTWVSGASQIRSAVTFAFIPSVEAISSNASIVTGILTNKP